MPANGVYICHANLGELADPQGTTYGAIINVGTRPTFDHDSPSVEAICWTSPQTSMGRRCAWILLSASGPS